MAAGLWRGAAWLLQNPKHLCGCPVARSQRLPVLEPCMMHQMAEAIVWQLIM